MNPTINRRHFLTVASAAATFTAAPRITRGDLRPRSTLGYVVGEPFVEPIGMEILARGGNAIDAIVATALAGAVTQPHQTGIAGYGAHGVFAVDGGRKVIAIDANSVAPQSFTADIFKPDATGQVPGRKSHYGWLASGVPGVIAGLHKALTSYGTIPLSEALAPAIRLARDGFTVSKSLAASFASAAKAFRDDPGSAKLYLPGGTPPRAGQTWRNPDLAEVLMTLARAESVEPFYRGEIATRIAEAMRSQGGLVTTDDLAAYRAREVTPLSLQWGDRTIHTAPLTAGGLSVLQMLKLLKAMDYAEMPPGPRQLHARVEAMRLAWDDRLNLLGDPEKADVPQQRLLSDEYADQSAAQILAAVDSGTVIERNISSPTQGGTLNFSACDRHGNACAVTLTHGEAFGARVTVDGLGLTLGHGMSRFDPRPDHPNSPGPGKRPLHNMTPTVITRQGEAVVAIGGRGGRKIPNALFEFLTQHVVHDRPFDESLHAPRLHTEGSTSIEHQPGWPAATIGPLGQLGFQLKAGPSATLSGVARENGTWHAGMF